MMIEDDYDDDFWGWGLWWAMGIAHGKTELIRTKQMNKNKNAS